MPEPLVIKVLKYIGEHRGGAREKELATILTGSPLSAATVLQRLVQGGAVVQKGNLYLPGAKFSEIARRTSRVYQLLGQRSETVRLLRGLLSLTGERYILSARAVADILEREGLKRSAGESLIEQEAQKGYIATLRLCFCGEIIATAASFCVPVSFVRELQRLSWAEYANLAKTTGAKLMEVVYLLGRYPHEIAAQGRHYLEQKRKDVADRVAREAFKHWVTFLGSQFRTLPSAATVYLHPDSLVEV